MNHKDIHKIVQTALAEDIQPRDITTEALVTAAQKGSATIIAKEPAIICGLDIARAVFRQIDQRLKLHTKYRDGSTVRQNTRILTIQGPLRGILTAERTALNFLSYLSGIATLTAAFVQQVKPYRTKILDTRKTTPGYRALEKMAVRCGGGNNHRMSLSDMVMIKDNHVLAAGEKHLPNLIRRIRKCTRKRLEIEVDTLTQLTAVLPAHPDIILLDNMSLPRLRKAVAINRRQPRPAILEASGGITIRNVAAIARTGVHRISVGALTHTRKAIDFSLELGGFS